MMPHLFKASLGRRLYAIIVGIVIVLSALCGYVYYYKAKDNRTYERLFSNLSRLSNTPRQVSDVVGDIMLFQKNPSTELETRILARIDTLSRLSIKILADTDPENEDTVLILAGIGEIMGNLQQVSKTTLEQIKNRAKTLELYQNIELLNILRAVVQTNVSRYVSGELANALEIREAIARENRTLRNLLITLVGVSILSVFLLVRMVRKSILRPIQNLEESVHRFRRDGLYSRIDDISQDEIGSLAKAFNHMGEKVQNREQALRASEQKYRGIIENLQDVYLRTDMAGRILMISPSANRVLGYAADKAFVGLNIADVFYDDPQQRSVLLEQLKTKPTISNLEMRFKKADGSLCPILVSVSLYYDETGEPEGVEGIFRDISEIKQAVEELHRLRSYLANIIDSMPSVLIGVDTEGNITQWNSEAQRATGVSKASAVGKALEQVLPQFENDLEKIRRAVKTRQILSEKRRVREDDDDHQHLYEDVTIYPLISNGVEGAVVRVDNVTDQVRLEEMMVQSEKMLSVGGLAAGMAHEINNPLAGILQTTSVLSNRLGGNLNIKANHKAAENAGTTMGAITSYMEARGVATMLDTIKTSGQRVAKTVANMLSFARKSEAVVSSNRLDELIEKTLALAATDFTLKQQHDFKRIATIKVYDDTLPSVPCEGAKIQQVLLNLLRNGAQAMQAAETPAPCFTIRTHLDTASQMACIEIEDNGPGMDEATRKRVFEPFFTTKPEGVGTGLGLSVSYFIIKENHGGEMAVDSWPGKGTRFTIRLPIS